VEFFKKQTNFPFMATRKVWYTLSAILMIGSVVSFAPADSTSASTSPVYQRSGDVPAGCERGSRGEPS